MKMLFTVYSKPALEIFKTLAEDLGLFCNIPISFD